MSDFSLESWAFCALSDSGSYLNLLFIRPPLALSPWGRRRMSCCFRVGWIQVFHVAPVARVGKDISSLLAGVGGHIFSPDTAEVLLLGGGENPSFLLGLLWHCRVEGRCKPLPLSGGRNPGSSGGHQWCCQSWRVDSFLQVGMKVLSSWSSLVVQWDKDPMLSLQQPGCCYGMFSIQELNMQPKKKKLFYANYYIYVFI